MLRRTIVLFAVLMVSVVSLGPGLALAADAEHGEAKHAAAGHGEHGHSEVGLADVDLAELTKPEQFRSDLALFTFVVFLLLLGILWKFAWGPIVAGLEKREHSIADHIAEAKRQHDEAKQLLVQYEAKLAAAADEVRGLMEEARRDAEQTKQSILAEAKSGAETERLRGLRDIESATDAALQTLAERSAQLAVELAGKIVKTSLTPADQAKLVKEAVDRFPAAKPSRN